MNKADVTSTYFVLIGYSRRSSWTGSACDNVHVTRTELNWTGGRRCVSSVGAMWTSLKWQKRKKARQHDALQRAV